MSRNISIKAHLSDCKRRKKALILFEGKTDPKIYDKIIEENIPDLKEKFSLKKINDFNDFSTGGCTQIKRWLQENYDWLDSINDANKLMLGIIDGDAVKYKLKLKNRSKETCNAEKFIYQLKLYSMESYAFDEECLVELLKKYLDARECEIQECLEEPLYTCIKEKIQKTCLDLSLLCLLLHNNTIDSKFSYSLSMNTYSCYDHFISELNKEKEKFKNQIYDIKNELDITDTWDIVRQITKGKHLIYIICFILKDVFKNLQKYKLCDNVSFDAISEISCTKENDCIKSECIYKIPLGNGTPNFNGKEPINFIYSDIIDHFSTKELYLELSNHLIKMCS